MIGLIGSLTICRRVVGFALILVIHYSRPASQRQTFQSPEGCRGQNLDCVLCRQYSFGLARRRSVSKRCVRRDIVNNPQCPLLSYTKCRHCNSFGCG
jgi:hypothetical protein